MVLFPIMLYMVELGTGIYGPLQACAGQAEREVIVDAQRLRETELHVHTVGCYHPDQLFEMARDCYRQIHWNRFGFLDRYEQIFGVRLDPVAIFERASRNGSLDEIREVSVYEYHPGGTFEEFDITSHFSNVIVGYYLDREEHEPILEPILRRHREDGLAYVEYRNAFATHGEEFKQWHGRYARYLRDASSHDFTARYIIRLDGRSPVESYRTVRELIDENPDLAETIVGVDFSGKEIPPGNLTSFYDCIGKDRDRYPETFIEPTVHIGENFFDLSLESAIRWCHESALHGAKRLAHCIALGMRPAVAIARQARAHQSETVQERIHQAEYDLQHAEDLAEYGVCVDAGALVRELRDLRDRQPDERVNRPYCEDRLDEIVRRQDYVLDDMARLGTVIETCPTSNLCIGGVRGIEAHPFQRLYASDVNLAICTDDPGIFDTTLSSEVAQVCEWFGISERDLAARLGDPFQYRLARERASRWS